MSKIIYRQTDPGSSITTGSSVSKDSPLTNAEVDQNFLNINKTKLDADGTVATTQLQFEDDVGDIKNKIFYNNTLGALQIGDSGAKQIVFSGSISGLSVTAGDITLSSKNLILGSGDPYDMDPYDGVDSIIEADGAGIYVGEYVGGGGYVNLLFFDDEMAWKATTWNNTDINFMADDFKISTVPSKTLLNLYTWVDNINLVLGTNSVSATNNYTSNNTVVDNTSLKAAIEALDATNIPAVKTFIGQTGTSGTTYAAPNTSTTGIGLLNGDSLLAAIDKINAKMLYTIHTVEAKTANFTAESGRFYRVTPSSGATVVVTLPTSNRGAVMVRLEDSSTNRKVTFQTSSPDVIENLTSADTVTIDVAMQTIHFIWDGSSWRIA